MSTCNLRGTCFFYKNGLSKMPRTTDFIRFRYCSSDNNNCPWYVSYEDPWEIWTDERNGESGDGII